MLLNLGKLRLKEKIRAYFAFLILIPVILLSGITIIQVYDVSLRNAEDIANTLRSEEIQNLQRVTEQKITSIRNSFRKIDTDLQILSSTASEMLANTYLAPERPSFYWNYSGLGQGAIPGLSMNEDYGEPVSFDTSAWYLPPSNVNSTSNGVPVLDSPSDFVLRKTSPLDALFISIREGDSNYYWIYLGVEETGLFRIFPFVDLNSLYSDPVGPFDIRQTSYYNNASATQSTYFSEPYLEEGGSARIITAARAVYIGSSFAGVVAIDILIDSILEDFVDVHVQSSGYGFLVSLKKTLIAHPMYNASNFGTSVFSLESNSTDFNSIMDKLSLGTNGTGLYSKNGKQWIIFYAPVPSTMYSLAVVVPESEVIQPAIVIRNSAIDLVTASVMVFLVILGLVFTFILLASRITSNAIVKPIENLTLAMDYISKGDLDQIEEERKKPIPSEMKLFQNAFNDFLTMLQLGNKEYYRNDLSRAYSTFSRALEIFEQNNKKSGVGKCLAFLGKIERLWGNKDQAFTYYNRSIEIGQELNDKKALASRYNSMGILFLDQRNHGKAFQFFEHALQINTEIENYSGIATVIGNIAIIYSDTGDNRNAEGAFEDAIKIAKENYDDGALAYSYLNKAKFLIKQGTHNESVDLLNQALHFSRELKDMRLAGNVFAALSEVSAAQGHKDLSTQYRANAKRLGPKGVQKQIIFVLDVSGSMNGARLKAAKAGLFAMYGRQVTEDDFAGLIVFSDSTRQMIEMDSKAVNDAGFARIVEALQAEGGTAFYDALGLAVKSLEGFAADQVLSNEKWIVALTDGEDNRSVHWDLKESGRKSLIQFLKKQPQPVNIIIIGVGALRPDIEGNFDVLCSLTSVGKFIKINDPSMANAAIRQAYEEAESIIASSAREELEEFKYDE
ncbi:MAG TPA: tetratricopeptide repeat protein [Candidatus Hodarchaeales archaeon]|nr:tetratricopeptide repeat protein [Candidatus Hodarchaeales archaeon]